MVLDALVPIIKASRVPSCFVQRQDSLQFSAQVARNEEKLGNGTTSSLGNGTTNSTNHHFGLWTFLSYFASLNQTRNHIHIHHIIPYPSRGRYRVTPGHRSVNCSKRQDFPTAVSPMMMYLDRRPRDPRDGDLWGSGDPLWWAWPAIFKRLHFANLNMAQSK